MVNTYFRVVQSAIKSWWRERDMIQLQFSPVEENSVVFRNELQRAYDSILGSSPNNLSSSLFNISWDSRKWLREQGKMGIPKGSTPRSSGRLKVKSQRKFEMPTRDQILGAIETTPGKSYEQYRPRKLINNFVKERNFYNNRDDRMAMTDDDESFSDFIVEDEPSSSESRTKKKAKNKKKEKKRKQKQQSSESSSEELSDFIVEDEPPPVKQRRNRKIRKQRKKTEWSSELESDDKEVDSDFIVEDELSSSELRTKKKEKNKKKEKRKQKQQSSESSSEELSDFIVEDEPPPVKQRRNRKIRKQRKKTEWSSELESDDKEVDSDFIVEDEPPPVKQRRNRKIRKQRKKTQWSSESESDDKEVASDFSEEDEVSAIQQRTKKRKRMLSSSDSDNSDGVNPSRRSRRIGRQPKREFQKPSKKEAWENILEREPDLKETVENDDVTDFVVGDDEVEEDTISGGDICEESLEDKLKKTDENLSREQEDIDKETKVENQITSVLKTDLMENEGDIDDCESDSECRAIRRNLRSKIHHRSQISKALDSDGSENDDEKINDTFVARRSRRSRGPFRQTQITKYFDPALQDKTLKSASDI